MKSFFVLLSFLLLPVGAVATTTYSYKVRVPELLPLRSKETYISIPHATPDKHVVEVRITGDWPDVDHAYSNAYYGSLILTRYNRNRESSKLETTINVAITISRKVGGPAIDPDDDPEDICDDFPFCAPPPPPVIPGDDGSAVLVAILQPSADGSALLLWTAAEGGRVIFLYAGIARRATEKPRYGDDGGGSR